MCKNSNRPILPLIEAAQVTGEISVGKTTRRFQLQPAEKIMEPIGLLLSEADRCLSLLPVEDDPATIFRKEPTNDNYIVFYQVANALKRLLEMIRAQLGDGATPPGQLCVQCANLNVEQNVVIARLARVAFTLEEWFCSNRPRQGDEVPTLPSAIYGSWRCAADDFLNSEPEKLGSTPAKTRTCTDKDVAVATDKADSKTDNGTKYPALLPESDEVIKLCRKLKADLPEGYSQITIARDFTGEKEGEDKKAKSLLTQARRFRHLWDNAKTE